MLEQLCASVVRNCCSRDHPKKVLPSEWHDKLLYYLKSADLVVNALMHNLPSDTGELSMQGVSLFRENAASSDSGISSVVLVTQLCSVLFSQPDRAPVDVVQRVARQPEAGRHEVW